MRAGLIALALVAGSAWAQGNAYGPVRSGETLAAIARQLAEQAPGVDAASMQFALYASNPDAFRGGDINGLKLGAQLNVPPAAEVPALAEQGRRRATEAAVALRDSAARKPEVAPAPPRDGVEVVLPPESSFDLGNRTAPAQDAPPFVAPAVVETEDPQPLEPLAEESEPAPFANTVNSKTAQKLLMEKRAAEAFMLLAGLEEQYAGDPDFDYLFGVAALDSGAPTEALYPLRRAVDSRPEALGARVDLGRAYFEVADYESARAVFKELQSMSPPPQAAAVIESYLVAVDRASRRYRKTFAAYVGAETGFDTNANAATSAANFLGFQLDDTARATESPYFGAELSGDYTMPLVPRWRLLVGAEVNNREYSDAGFVSRLQLGASTGLRYEKGGMQADALVDALQLQVDGDNNLSAFGITLGTVLPIAAGWGFEGSVRAAGLRFQSDFSERDVDQILVSAGLVRGLSILRGGRAQLALQLGQDSEVESGSPYGRDLFGLRGELVVGMSPRVQLLAHAELATADYGQWVFSNDAEDTTAAREDVTFATEIGANFADNRYRGWLLRTSLRYAQNASDIDFYDYDRVDVGVSIRRFFE